jgi:hypothetical protein
LHGVLGLEAKDLGDFVDIKNEGDVTAYNH